MLIRDAQVGSYFFQLAEDYKLELNEAKAKITNFAYQVSSLKEQNKNLLDEMGEKIRTSKDEIKATANTEIQKMVLREYIFDPPLFL